MSLQTKMRRGELTQNDYVENPVETIHEYFDEDYWRHRFGLQDIDVKLACEIVGVFRNSFLMKHLKVQANNEVDWAGFMRRMKQLIESKK